MVLIFIGCGISFLVLGCCCQILRIRHAICFP